MNKLIDKFAENVLTTNESFVIENEGKYYVFIQCNVGNAKYIYADSDYSFGNANFYAGTDLQPKLSAIIADGKIYIFDEYVFDIWRTPTENMPVNVYKFADIYERANKYANDVIFQEFYSALPIDEITNERDIDTCKQRAREELLMGKKAREELLMSKKKMCGFSFETEDVAMFLAGLVDLDTKPFNHFKKDEEHWRNVKSFALKSEEFVKDKSVVKLYELEMASGLKTVNAKTVCVEFEMNGITASAKISPSIILRHLCNNDFFVDYDFVSRKSGKEVITKLGAATWKWDTDKQVLTCGHIVKITYGKKVLYER